MEPQAESTADTPTTTSYPIPDLASSPQYLCSNSVVVSMEPQAEATADTQTTTNPIPGLASSQQYCSNLVVSMVPQVEGTTVYPIPNLESPMASSYSDYDSVDFGYLTDATDNNSTAATPYNDDIGNFDYFTGSTFPDDDFFGGLEIDMILRGNESDEGGTEGNSSSTMETASLLDDFMSTDTDDEPIEPLFPTRFNNKGLESKAAIGTGNLNFDPSGNVSDDCGTEGNSSNPLETASLQDDFMSTATDDELTEPPSVSLPQNEKGKAAVGDGNDKPTEPPSLSLPQNEKVRDDKGKAVIGDGDGNGESSISIIMKVLGSDTLSWKAPVSTLKSLTVFWSHPLAHKKQLSSVPYSIHEKIKTALSKFMAYSEGNILAQFWAPKMIAGRRTLTTLDQPFGVYGIDRGFAWYRKRCLDYKIDVGDEIEDDLGLPGRVFRNKWPEFTSDVKFYSIQEYPLCNIAAHCGVKRALGLPIFTRSGGCCVGVLEIVDAEENVFFDNVLEVVHFALKLAKLQSSYMYFNAAMQKCPPYAAAKEINWILLNVGATHKLPLAQAWHCLLKSGNLFKGKFAEVASTYRMPYYECDRSKTYDFRMSCKEHLLRKDQGFVGKVLIDYEPRFCIDVAQLGTTGHPFAICARNSGLSACLAVCLIDRKDVNEVYILEFFLPPCNAQSPETFFLPILTTIKQNLRKFKISSGGKGNEISVKVIELPLTNEVDAFKPTIRGFSAASSEIQKEVEEPLDSGILVIKDLSAMPMRNVESNAAATSSRSTYSGANSSKKKQKNAANVISLEVIKQHFGRKLEDAADSLGVSRSKLKSDCRYYDIPRWPTGKRTKGKKGNHSLASSSAGNVSELAIRDPSSPTPPPKEVTAGVMPSEDTSCVTVKALYKKDILRFRLSSSSGMAELMENVAKRVNLEVETFRLKYEDDEGEIIVLTCDEDLQECFRCLSGRATVKFFVEQDTSHAP